MIFTIFVNCAGVCFGIFYCTNNSIFDTIFDTSIFDTKFIIKISNYLLINGEGNQPEPEPELEPIIKSKKKLKSKSSSLGLTNLFKNLKL